MCPLIYSGIFISCYHFLRRTKAYIVYRHGMIRLAYLKLKNPPSHPQARTSTFTLFLFLAVLTTGASSLPPPF